MKKSGTANEIVKPIVVLTVICLVVTALLAYVNLVTSPIISESEKEAAAQAAGLKQNRIPEMQKRSQKRKRSQN